MADEKKIHKPDAPIWFLILGPLGSILIGQTVKGIVGIVALFIPIIGWFFGWLIWALFAVDVYMIIKYWQEGGGPIGPWDFFWSLPKKA